MLRHLDRRSPTSLAIPTLVVSTVGLVALGVWRPAWALGAGALGLCVAMALALSARWRLAGNPDPIAAGISFTETQEHSSHAVMVGFTLLGAGILAAGLYDTTRVDLDVAWDPMRQALGAIGAPDTAGRREKPVRKVAGASKAPEARRTSRRLQAVVELRGQARHGVVADPGVVTIDVSGDEADVAALGTIKAYVEVGPKAQYGVGHPVQVDLPEGVRVDAMRPSTVTLEVLAAPGAAAAPPPEAAVEMDEGQGPDDQPRGQAEAAAAAPSSARARPAGGETLRGLDAPAAAAPAPVTESARDSLGLNDRGDTGTRPRSVESGVARETVSKPGDVNELMGALDRKPRSRAPAHVPADRPARGDRTLTRKQITSVVRRHARDVQRCNKGLIRQVDTTVTVAMVIQPSGKVASATVTRGSNRLTDACVERVVRGFRFPSFTGEPLRINMPFRL